MLFFLNHSWEDSVYSEHPLFKGQDTLSIKEFPALSEGLFKYLRIASDKVTPESVGIL